MPQLLGVAPTFCFILLQAILNTDHVLFVAMNQSTQFRFVLYSDPASQLSETQKVCLRDELRAFASLSLSPLPEYQVLLPSVDEAFRDKILVLAYDMTSQPAQLTGFASSIWLDIPGIGQRVLHIGLAVVAPRARYGGLTYEMNGRILLHTLMNVYPGGHWISNLSSVLNVLGKFGDFTAQPYPSPASWAARIPSETHLRIARWIDAHARAYMHISPASVFDERTFVFKDLNVGTAFTKDIDDDACQHRSEDRNVFFKRLLRKHHADGVLQVGWVDPQRCAKLVLSPDFRALRDVAHTVLARPNIQSRVTSQPELNYISVTSRTSEIHRNQNLTEIADIRLKIPEERLRGSEAALSGMRTTPEWCYCQSGRSPRAEKLFQSPQVRN